VAKGSSRSSGEEKQKKQELNAAALERLDRGGKMHLTTW
jgi:hypothetical protein